MLNNILADGLFVYALQYNNFTKSTTLQKHQIFFPLSRLRLLTLQKCKLKRTKFNIMSAVFATNCTRSCKYSILAEVYFEIKRLDK